MSNTVQRNENLIINQVYLYRITFFINKNINILFNDKLNLDKERTNYGIQTIDIKVP